MKKPEPKPARGMPRSLLYALIPLGFVLMIALMLMFGRAEEERSQTPEQAAAEAQEGIPAQNR